MVQKPAMTGKLFSTDMDGVFYQQCNGGHLTTGIVDSGLMTLDFVDCFKIINGFM